MQELKEITHYESWIRRQAKSLGLIAKKDRRSQRWYFSDLTNHLVSDRNGLTYLEANDFLIWWQHKPSWIQATTEKKSNP